MLGSGSDAAGRSYVDHARRLGVRDEAVLAALAAVPRERFVPPGSDAGPDRPVALPYGQTTSQPSLVALMVDALGIGPSARVLEIGTGYGYQAAILGRLAGEVWTVERWPELAEAARTNLAAAGATNVHVVAGDGTDGLAAHAPFDGIVVAARAEEVSAVLASQLAPGGRLVLPLGPAGAERAVVLGRTHDGALRVERDLGEVRFVPLVPGSRARPAT